MNVNFTRSNAMSGGFHVEAVTPLDYGTDREMPDVLLTQSFWLSRPM